MFPEWGRFVTAVKLNRGLKTSNYDQLYAYLKQHASHANENKMMLERYNQHAINPFALVFNVSPHQYPSQSSANPQSAYVPPVTHQPQFADNTHLDSVQNVQGRQNRGQGNYARGAVVAGNGGAQNRVGNTNPGQAKQIKCYNCNGENGVVLDEEQLLFIAGGQTNTFDDDMDEAPVQDLALDVLSCRAFNRGQRLSRLINVMLLTYDVEELLTAQSMFMKKVEIGYKNPLNLTKAKQVQPALYNGHELVKTTHTPAVVHDLEDTLELAETNRMKMLEKSKITTASCGYCCCSRSKKMFQVITTVRVILVLPVQLLLLLEEFLLLDLVSTSVFVQMVAAAKLPVLSPGKFELWKMRIEQYFLMTDYALWEVIVNGDSPHKENVDGVEQTYPPTKKKCRREVSKKE
ncbi:hypothetical protein Tco_1467786 [Tanacetum coccineum]